MQVKNDVWNTATWSKPIFNHFKRSLSVQKSFVEKLTKFVNSEGNFPLYEVIL